VTGVRERDDGHNVGLVDTFTGRTQPNRLIESLAQTRVLRGPGHAGPSLDGVPPSAIRGHAKRTSDY